MQTLKNLPLPPWDMETAAQRLQLLEDACNTKQPDQIAAHFTEQTEARFGTSFLTGQQAIRNYFKKEFAEKRNFKINLDLWGALKGRMAVRSEATWQDENDTEFRTFGVQVFQFTDDGLIAMNYASFNDEALGK